jgi:hypothetical protein
MRAIELFGVAAIIFAVIAPVSYCTIQTETAKYASANNVEVACITSGGQWKVADRKYGFTITPAYCEKKK